MSPSAHSGLAYGQITTREPVATEQRLVSHTVTTPVSQGQTRSEVEAKVREYFQDIPIMVEIARCESTFRHRLSNGEVLRGYVDGADTGVMQINLRYHQRTADQLGLDMENIYDNMAYARYLYERQGTQPWNASAPCWNRHVAIN